MVAIIDLVIYSQKRLFKIIHLKIIQKDYWDSRLLVLFFPLNKKKWINIWKENYIAKQSTTVMGENKSLSWNIKGHNEFQYEFLVLNF